MRLRARVSKHKPWEEGSVGICGRAMQEQEEAGARRSSACRHFQQTGQTGTLGYKAETSQANEPAATQSQIQQQ